MNADCHNLEAFISGSLSPEVAMRCEGHLAACAACAAEVSRQLELDRLLALARDRIEPVPPRLRRRVEGMLTDRENPSRWRSSLWRYAPLATAAGLFLA